MNNKQDILRETYSIEYEETDGKPTCPHCGAGYRAVNTKGDYKKVICKDCKQDFAYWSDLFVVNNVRDDNYIKAGPNIFAIIRDASEQDLRKIAEGSEEKFNVLTEVQASLVKMGKLYGPKDNDNE